MDTLLAVGQLATLVALGIAALFFKTGLSSYMSDKGKNLATKEDIADITHKIESVKSLYQHEIERMRSALSVAVSRRNALAEQQRQAFLQFFDRCGEILDKLSISPGDLPLEEGKAFAQHEQDTIRLFSAIVMDYNRMTIFCDVKSELPAVAEKVAQSALEIHRAFRKHFGPVKFRAIDAYKALISGNDDDYRAATDAFSEATKRLHDAIEPHQNEMREWFFQFTGLLNLYMHSRTKKAPAAPLKEIP